MLQLFPLVFFWTATVVTREASTLLGSFHNHVPLEFCKRKENTANQLSGWSIIHKPHPFINHNQNDIISKMFWKNLHTLFYTLTKFSASEAAEAMNYMAMAGWKTEDMLSGIEGVMNLAAASGEDLATTSDIVTDALTAFGLTAKDSGHFADVLAAASSNANTNVSMMGETFKYCAPIAGALGFSVEDTAEAIGLMANAGIKSTQAGTSLRTIMTNLSGEVKICGENIGEETMDFDADEMKKAGYCIWDVKPGTYVVFDCIGEDGDCISDTWSKFYKEFLPQMGYEPEAETDYEIYFEKGRNGLFCELWIPVRRKIEKD